MFFKVRKKRREHRDNALEKFRTFGHLLREEVNAAFFHVVFIPRVWSASEVVEHHVSKKPGNAFGLLSLIIRQIIEIRTGAETLAPLVNDDIETVVQQQFF
jgi:hypothetical protein